uniref:Uncharacterized protein n=1 Tax=Cucumis melo TaxID=3656 RepID=A0A9I9EAD6_CUCME
MKGKKEKRKTRHLRLSSSVVSCFSSLPPPFAANQNYHFVYIAPEVLLKKEYDGKEIKAKGDFMAMEGSFEKKRIKNEWHFKDDLHHTFAFLNRSFRCFEKVELNQTCHFFADISCLRQKIIAMKLIIRLQMLEVLKDAQWSNLNIFHIVEESMDHGINQVLIYVSI